MAWSHVVLALASVLASVECAVVGHDAVPVWRQPTAANSAQQLALRFKPYLNIVNGCQPYPAVDANGNTGGGLKPTGGQSDSCDDKSKAQVYSRSGYYGGLCAIMYSWYMPKDSPSSGLGHRHEWENAIVWLDNPASVRIVAISASAHSGYKTSEPADWSYLVNRVNPKISYKSTWPVDHEMGFTSAVGTQQPLIQWEQMTQAARNALEWTDFGSATMPFKSNFDDNLSKAYFL